MIRDTLAVALFLFVCLIAFITYKNKQDSQMRIDELQEVNNLLESQLGTVISVYEDVVQKTVELHGAQLAIDRQFNKQQEETRRLQSDVQEIKDWADSSLPSSIIGLRQRPAITGSNLYRSLSTGNALRAQSE